ncbi:hypothetical protein CEP54_011089 [Fusarium duplospermum]|uniref:Uncharacterized protein n=1 Tax=Fusarium duplospermum TaxID=1325734 RepID=A0A428PGF6_9HYPO|nr:hypothetical protein CEP54_011089 [Fusarium duplospermum]
MAFGGFRAHDSTHFGDYQHQPRGKLGPSLIALHRTAQFLAAVWHRQLRTSLFSHLPLTSTSLLLSPE